MQTTPMPHLQSRPTLAAWMAVAALLPAAVASGQSPPPGPTFELAVAGLPSDGRWKSTPVLVDLNKDGHLDLVAHVRLGRKAGAWLGDGKGGWTDVSQGLAVPEATTCGGGVAVADANGDGSLDVAVADHCEGALVFLGDGKGKWTLATGAINPEASKRPEYEGSDNPFTGAEDLAAGDVNGDGHVDLLLGASDRGGLILLTGDGSGKTWKEVKVTGLPTADDPGEGADDEGGWVRRVILTDMNGDGKLDTVAAYHRGPRVYLGDGKGSFKSASQGFPSPMLYGVIQSLTTGDVNGDKRPDVVVAHAVNGVEVYLQQEDGSWKQQPDPLPEIKGGCQAAGLGDLDGDGDLDLIVGGRKSTGKTAGYGLFVLTNDGKGSWTRTKTAFPEDDLEITWGITTGDVNHDGRTDLVVGLGGAGGRQSEQREAPDKPATGKLPNLQVWLNTTPK
jgi:hypothetical protein